MLRISGGEHLRGLDEHDISRKVSWCFSQYNNGNLSRCSRAEVYHVRSRSLEASRSRVGIAEWNDTG
jgi:hypothetical protein